MENGTVLGADAIQKLSFEEAYERLNETAARLERGNLSLEISLALYEEGVLLSQHCEDLLNKAELRVSQVAPLSAGFGREAEVSGEDIDETDFPGEDEEDTADDDEDEDDEDDDPLARLF